MGIRTSEQLKALFLQRKEINERKKAFKPKTEKEKQDYQKQYQKQYRESHKEYAKEKSKQYRETHREFLREYYRARYHNQPKPIITDFPPPPIKTKKQLKELYSNWLQQLKEREKYLTGEALQFNQLMQISIEMGRTPMTNEQARDNYKNYVEIMHDLIEKRKSLDKDDPQREELTRKISKYNTKLCYLRKTFGNAVGEKPTFDNTPKIKTEVGQTAKAKLKEIEELAKQKIEIAKQQGNLQEIKIIEERLNIVRLRYKYSYSLS